MHDILDLIFSDFSLVATALAGLQYFLYFWFGFWVLMGTVASILWLASLTHRDISFIEGLGTRAFLTVAASFGGIAIAAVGMAVFYFMHFLLNLNGFLLPFMVDMGLLLIAVCSLVALVAGLYKGPKFLPLFE